MRNLVFPLLFAIFSFSSSATFLENFYQNPRDVMNSLPVKKYKALLKFSDMEIQDRNFVVLKDRIRQRLVGENKSGIISNDRASVLMEGAPFISNIYQMKKEKLESGRVSIAPWSDDYWPIYSGIIGKRYADRFFAYRDDFHSSHQYILDLPAMDILAAGDSEKINQLSPAEKYDLLIGDENFTLTNKMWAEGQMYYDRYGEVETWMGICHGWAPASFMLDRPLKKIVVKAADGLTDLHFYPADIKALTSLLWANTQVPTHFLGGRCNSKDPEEDDSGRVIDQDCFDNNPGSWHQAIVNVLGKEKGSFVFDATYDYQVWNQPIISYEYTYFNPQTLKENVSLSRARIPIGDFVRDEFKEYRSSEARYVVGIEMEVVYSVETEPTQRVNDGEIYDGVNSVSYIYDLELDRNGEIVGGEWYSNYHPDFVWRPHKNSRALSYGDYNIDSGLFWSEREPVPASWKHAAILGARYGQPLAAIVEEMIKRSRK